MVSLASRLAAAACLLITVGANLNTWTQINGERWGEARKLLTKIFKLSRVASCFCSLGHTTHLRYGRGYKDPFNAQARLPNLYRVPLPTPPDQWEAIWKSIPFLAVDVPPQVLHWTALHCGLLSRRSWWRSFHSATR